MYGHIPEGRSNGEEKKNRKDSCRLWRLGQGAPFAIGRFIFRRKGLRFESRNRIAIKKDGAWGRGILPPMLRHYERLCFVLFIFALFEEPCCSDNKHN